MKAAIESFSDLFVRGRTSFHQCIFNPDNDQLKNELDIGLDEIVLKEDFISFRFDSFEVDLYVVIVSFRLYSPDGHYVGKYEYHQNGQNVFIDDKLVFY